MVTVNKRRNVNVRSVKGWELWTIYHPNLSTIPLTLKVGIGCKSRRERFSNVEVIPRNTGLGQKWEIGCGNHIIRPTDFIGILLINTSNVSIM